MNRTVYSNTDDDDDDDDVLGAQTGTMDGKNGMQVQVLGYLRLGLSVV